MKFLKYHWTWNKYTVRVRKCIKKPINTKIFEETSFLEEQKPENKYSNEMK